MQFIYYFVFFNYLYLLVRVEQQPFAEERLEAGGRQGQRRDHNPHRVPPQSGQGPRQLSL